VAIRVHRQAYGKYAVSGREKVVESRNTSKNSLEIQELILSSWKKRGMEEITILGKVFVTDLQSLSDQMSFVAI
jgi:hypothetical protein